MAGDDDLPHIAVLASPGMGHVIPCVELCRRLATDHGFSLTLITFGSFTIPADLLSTLPPTVDTVRLPAVPAHDLLPTSADIITELRAMSARSVPALISLLRELKRRKRLVALVTDTFGVNALPDVRDELGIAPLLFYTANQFCLSFLLNLPGAARDVPEEIVRMAHDFRRYPELVLVNSFDAIEPLAAGEAGDRFPQTFSVGPLIRSIRTVELEPTGLLAKGWMNEQPPESVLFVAFGSWGTMPAAQVREIACGLEKSGHRFLWVTRRPSDHEPDSNNPLSFLPAGFLDRVSGIGVVVEDWAPQVEVLAHPATGGFLTHCGWNSALESIVHGIPMIAWPLCAEQNMNAALLVEESRVAIRPVPAGDGIVNGEEVARVVKELFEEDTGMAVRRRAVELRDAAAAAISPVGKSSVALTMVADKLKGLELGRRWV